jgi:hypothetical protein
MSKRHPLTEEIRHEEIVYFADDRRPWERLIPTIKRSTYRVQSTSDLSIHGDAPKCFLLVKGYQPGISMRRTRNWSRYISKVGSKWYPVESITEQLITRVGQHLGFDVADSLLRMVGRQVRFLSRYFLDDENESLAHGIELFRDNFGHDFVEDVAARKVERSFYTFSVVIKSIERTFPEAADAIVSGFVQMLLFDAIVGNNDRHPANWGVITSTRMTTLPRFSPIFDTARGLFWNASEAAIRLKLADKGAFQAYITNSRPQIGWHEEPNLNHFHLLQRIVDAYPEYRGLMENKAKSLDLDRCGSLLREEFSSLMSSDRLRLILTCLEARLSEVRRVVCS